MPGSSPRCFNSSSCEYVRTRPASMSAQILSAMRTSRTSARASAASRWVLVQLLHRYFSSLGMFWRVPDLPRGHRRVSAKANHPLEADQSLPVDGRCRSLTLVGWRNAASPICQMWRMTASWCRRLVENFAKLKPFKHSGCACRR